MLAPGTEGSIEIKGGTDQGEVGKSLWEVA